MSDSDKDIKKYISANMKNFIETVSVITFLEDEDEEKKKDEEHYYYDYETLPYI